MRQPAIRRSGVTLIELMVVMTIMAALAALAAMILPTLKQKNAAATAAQQIQGYFSLSKLRAIRDQAPRGIRLIRDPDNATIVNALQYIEQPESLRPQVALTLSKPNSTGNTVTAMLPAGQFWANLGVSAGDHVELTYGGGLILPINQLGGGINGNQAVLEHRAGQALTNCEPNNPTNPTTLLQISTKTLLIQPGEYRIIRAARPMVGEPVVQLPRRIGIDLSKCNPVPAGIGLGAGTEREMNVPVRVGEWCRTGDNSPLDILFNSGGRVSGISSGRILLWVTPIDGSDGAPTLININTRTGAISVVEAFPGSGDAYQAAKTGLDNGL